MIRRIETITDADLETIASIWLRSNLEAHAFIDRNYWLKNYQTVKVSLTTADLYAYYHNEKIIGFLGLIDEYIAGIFVLQEYRSLGIGGQLLARIKEKHSKLLLSVYQKNERAVQFYLKQGFTILKETTDYETTEEEFLMEWIL
ncbi:GNAT family N-acetyltransferase [Enterococcus avium]|uniref:GNAT family N-acetyltransferase n=1 Tax=Enterococcus avium TaxID=33945 RepID=UPI0027011D0E|nr:GNAT family N-acetyltransferase [Enterococcus avium]MDO7800592.1 GNAT family N-acetyltransferase [Enterococcus avium]